MGSEAAHKYLVTMSEGSPMPGYEPKYDWGIGHKGESVAVARGVKWLYGPAKSGVYKFRLVDEASTTRLGEGRAELHVQIRRKNGSVTPVYVYFFDNIFEALAIYQDMRDSPHPFTRVLVPRVIEAQIPYTRK